MEGMNVRSVTGTDQREGLTIRLPRVQENSCRFEGKLLKAEMLK